MITDAIIISDLHLGSDNCHAKKINHLLDLILEGKLQTNTLILNGDVFDSLDFRRLKKQHWKLLSNIRKLSDKIAVIWIAGNHDISTDIICHLIGVEVKDEHILRTNDQSIFITHGHRYDEFIDKHPILTWIGDTIYWLLQKLDKSHQIARFAKVNSKVFLRCAEKVMIGAVAEAKQKNCTIACAGHTHHAGTWLHDGVKYLNSGCWTESPSHYILVRGEEIELVNFSEDSGQDDQRIGIINRITC